MRAVTKIGSVRNFATPEFPKSPTLYASLTDLHIQANLWTLFTEVAHSPPLVRLHVRFDGCPTSFRRFPCPALVDIMFSMSVPIPMGTVVELLESLGFASGFRQVPIITVALPNHRMWVSGEDWVKEKMNPYFTEEEDMLAWFTVEGIRKTGIACKVEPFIRGDGADGQRWSTSLVPEGDVADDSDCE